MRRQSGWRYFILKNQENEIKLTIFTPAYNRAHTLKRTYESLRRQSCKEFIWLIIDDGSTDSTKEIVSDWRINNDAFTIEYIYKENGGMHTAHNEAYKAIHTLLNMCIDSDDYLPENAVEIILKKWSHDGSDDYAGIIALDVDINGNVIGKKLPKNLISVSTDDYYMKYKGKGDKKFIYRTDVIKKYPDYPIFDNEKYLSLAYKYRLISQDYEMLILNEPVCIVEYQTDGSSNTMWRQYYQNPNGFAFMRKINMIYVPSIKRKIIECIHYVSSSKLAGNRNFVKDSPLKLLTILCIPFGLVLKKIIVMKNRN